MVKISNINQFCRYYKYTYVSTLIIMRNHCIITRF